MIPTEYFSTVALDRRSLSPPSWAPSLPSASLVHHPPRHLHDVHSAAIPTIPSTAAAAYSALQLAALHALNHDPSNDCAAVAFHATRVVLWCTAMSVWRDDLSHTFDESVRV